MPAMKSVVSWHRFVTKYRNAPPLRYASGLRHHVKKGVCCPMHSHSAIEIVYHPKGRGITRLANGRYVAFTEGSVVVYAPEERHDQTLDCDGEDLCVMLAVPSRHRGVPSQGFTVERVEDAAVIEDIRLLSQGRVKLTANEQAIFNFRVTSTLFALLHLARTKEEESAHGMERYVQKAEQYVRDHFATLVTLKEAAEHAGIGYDHLRHAVKSLRGRSLVRYLTEVRIERAKTLLSHSQLSLKEIATLCGFRDEYYFSAVFRRFARMPPGRYRAGQY
jgi:AraC-like DNA-binding protein